MLACPGRPPARRFWHSCASWSFEPRFAYAGHPGRHWARGLRFEHRHGGGGGDSDDFFGAGLGVRRPLRFLAFRLELDDAQTAALARILEHLKLERAQAALDIRRAASALADALEGDFPRAAATRRVQDAVAKALEELHALLEPEQRRELAELIRSGGIRI